MRTRSASKLPQREYSAGIGLFFSHVPFAYWKKLSCGFTDRSKVAGSTDARAQTMTERAATQADRTGFSMPRDDARGSSFAREMMRNRRPNRMGGGIQGMSGAPPTAHSSRSRP